MGEYGAPAGDGYGAKISKSAEEEKTITTVIIKNFAFEPAIVTISAGDTLLFVNEDSAPHTATADAFNTDRLNVGESASIAITSAGTYEYICAIHPSMKGTVIVE